MTYNLNTNPDILIIGGGVAGVAASVGATQSGASVVLIERNGFTGGKATAAYVGTVCGLYLTGRTGTPKFVVNGFAREFGEKVMSKSNTQPEFQKEGLHFFPYEREAFIKVCDSYLEKQNTRVLLNATFVDVHVSDEQLQEVHVFLNQQKVAFFPKAVIDTTGEAKVTEMSGIELIQSDQYQAAAHVFAMTGITAKDHSSLQMGLNISMVKAISSGRLPESYGRLSVVPGSYRMGRAVFKLGVPFPVNNEPNGVAVLKKFSQTAIREITEYLQQHSEVFKNSSIAFIAPETGIRTGPRNMGEFVLNEHDVLNCRKHHDSIARGSWPMEYWEPGKNPVLTFFNENDFYDIPPGALISKHLKNLFFAGRNISADEKAIASARVIGTCLQTGFAAGMLAAGFVNGREQRITVEDIQKAQF